MKGHADPQSLWDSRSKYFFKPLRSYGGKASYKGASISRKIFQAIVDGDYLAQEYVPAGKINVADERGELKEFKYDLRFYVYRDEVQLVMARLYQGQLTNFQSPGGGCASVCLQSS